MLAFSAVVSKLESVKRLNGIFDCFTGLRLIQSNQFVVAIFFVMVIFSFFCCYCC